MSYTANNLDQYSAVGAVTPAYDANGNLTYDGTFTYGYDAESRLVSVTQGGTAVATYAYDAQGHRKAKTVGATPTIYVTDPANRAVLDYDGTSGAVQRWYTVRHKSKWSWGSTAGVYWVRNKPQQCPEPNERR